MTAPASPGPAPAAMPREVLLVDDDRGVLDILNEIFEYHGYQRRLAGKQGRPPHTHRKGEDIPIGARLFSVADAFDAMTVDRPYSRAISMESARDEIGRSAGSHFDPAVADAFLSIPLEVLKEIYRRSLE